MVVTVTGIRFNAIAANWATENLEINPHRWPTVNALHTHDSSLDNSD